MAATYTAIPVFGRGKKQRREMVANDIRLSPTQGPNSMFGIGASQAHKDSDHTAMIAVVH